MKDGDGGYDKRIQASIPAELKDQVRTLVASGAYDSESEVVRAALRGLMTAAPPPAALPASPLPFEMPDEGRLPPMPQALAAEMPFAPLADDQHRDLKERLDLLAWLLTVLLMLVATAAARILSLLTRQPVEPMHLLRGALAETADERACTRRELAVGWRAFRQTHPRQHDHNES
jgi:hypothetical protein